jgi:Flp pilus assembly protein TadG
MSPFLVRVRSAIVLRAGGHDIPAVVRRRWRRQWRRLWRDQGGAPAIEAALLLPVMFAFLLGIEELGRLLWTQSVLQYASETAARYAVINPSGSIASYASSHAFGVSVPAGDFTYTATGACGGPQVIATYAFQPLVPQLVPALAMTLSAKSCLP